MVDCGKIYTELLAAGLPCTGVSSPDGVAVIDTYSRALSGEERAEADAIIADPMNLVRRPRPLHDIHVDVNALTGAQLTNVWTDLNSGTPAKVTLDEGTNAGSIYVMNYLAVMVGGLSPAEKT